MSIFINGEKLNPAPSSLNEAPKIKSSSQTAINGNIQETIVGEVKHVKMSWNYIKPEVAKKLLALYTSHTPVKYMNDNSPLYGKLEFDGVIKVSLGEYARGGSGMMSCNVEISEGEKF